MNNLAERMTVVRKERLRLRREMFRFLRGNKHHIKDDSLLKKMRDSYITDLSDLALIRHTKKVMEAIDDAY